MIYFPQQDAVHLERGPLSEVICQIRFPPVLRITSEQPVAFQERIRGQFPQLEIEHNVLLQTASPGTEAPSTQPTPRVFRFKSLDGRTTVALGVDFYALSTRSYTHWADFLDNFQLVSQAAHEIYDLVYAVRVGLRYINHLTLENTGTSNVAELLEILRPELTGLLQGDCWDEPLEMINHLSLAGNDDERLTLRSGFRRGEETIFLLDLDYYSEGNIPLENLPGLCQRYHDVIYDAFHWCIREEKLKVFAPIPVVEGD